MKTGHRSAVARALLACVALAALCVAWMDRSISMAANDTPVLDSVVALARLPAWSPEQIAAVLGITPTAAPERSNRHFEVFLGRGEAASFVGELELRIPRQGSRAKGPFLYFTLKQGRAPNAAQVIARFGRPHAIRVPPPQAAATGASIYVYSAKETELRFALGAAPEETVLSIAIDRSG